MYTQNPSYQSVSSTKVGIIGLSALSWCALWVWGQSAYSAVLDHGDWTQAGFIQGLCANIPGVSQAMVLALSLLTWILMVQGMMLPISVKAFEQFVATFKAHKQFKAMLMCFVSGYLFLSIIFGITLHSVGYGIGVFAHQTGMLLFDGWIIGAVVFGSAGLFQLSAAKTRLADRSCHLDCTSFSAKQTLSGLLWASAMTGLRHGFFCFMCCWALMCLMFVFWTGSLIWMLCLSVIMVAERQSAELRMAVGALLILATCGITFSHLILT